MNIFTEDEYDVIPSPLRLESDYGNEDWDLDIQRFADVKTSIRRCVEFNDETDNFIELYFKTYLMYSNRFRTRKTLAKALVYKLYELWFGIHPYDCEAALKDAAENLYIDTCDIGKNTLAEAFDDDGDLTPYGSDLVREFSESLIERITGTTDAVYISPWCVY